MRAIKHRNTFSDVLVNCDDQDIVRELLARLVPDEVKQQVVEGFNKHIDRYNDSVARLQRSVNKI